MTYRLIIFDFDGTLADSAPWFVTQLNELAARHRFRQVDDAEIEALRRCGNREIIRRLGVAGWRMPLIAADLKARMAADAERIPLFSGAAALLKRLEEHGVAVAVVTSNSEANVRRILGPEAAGAIAHYACGAGLFGKAKKFRRVMARAGVAPAQTLCVGDEQRDIEAAFDVGAAAGAVAWGYAAPDLLARCGPTVMFDTPAQISDHVLKGAAAA